MVAVVEAIMLHVVAEGGHEQNESVSVIEARVLLEILFVQNQIAVLRDVTSMQVVMVLDAALVLVVDLHDECQELMVVHNLEQVIAL